MTLTDLAERAEISKGYLSELENGKRSPTPPVLARLATALGCEIPDLLANRAVA